jgi:outer membrane protein assembly factor BamA
MFKILAARGLMQKRKGMNKMTVRGWIFLPVFFYFFVSPVLGWIQEKKDEENKGKQEKNRLLVLPIVYYTPETRIAGGVGGISYLRSLEDRERGYPSTLFMNMIYTQNKQFILGFAPDLYLGEGKFHLIGSLFFKKYTEKFYGIGPQTSKDWEEDFRYRSFSLKFSLQQKFLRNFYGGVQFDFENSRITEKEPGGILDREDIPGDNGGRVSGLGLVIVQDSRNNMFFPTGGTYLQLQASFFGRALGSEFKFQKYRIDCRQYVGVFSSHVLVFRMNTDFSAGNVPFQWLPTLGGSSVMRGYIQGRFRDRHAISLQAEYRVPLFWRLSAAGFVGCGDVADKLTSFKVREFKLNGGLGIRYRIDRRSGTNVRLDFGFAKGSFTVYAMINEAF